MGYSGGMVAQTGNVLFDKVAGLNDSLYVYSVVSTTIPFIEPEKHCERIGQQMAGSAEDIADLDFGMNKFVCIGSGTTEAPKQYVDIRTNTVHDGWFGNDENTGCYAFACCLLTSLGVCARIPEED